VTEAARGEDVPGWLTALAEAAVGMPVPAALQPGPGGRPAAVLILFGPGAAGPDLLLVQRGPRLRRHAGQPAFPGGAIDAADGGPVQAALREAAEEALVDPSGVQVLAVLPDLFISRSGFTVTPVLAWWRQPAPVGPGDPGRRDAGLGVHGHRGGPAARAGRLGGSLGLQQGRGSAGRDADGGGRAGPVS